MEEPEPQTVRAAQRGDLRAFERLVRGYQPPVWRLACHLVRDEALAEDVTQETFVRVYRFLPKYRGDSKFSTWLFSIARNCARDELRRAERRERTTRKAESAEPVVSPDLALHMVVREQLARLPAELREPLVLIDVFACSYAEVAKMLGAPEGTIKSRVHRGRLLLLEHITKDEEVAGEG